MAIVSRYLQNVEGTLEDYTFSNKGSGDENSTKKMEYIREDIANALALSALSGDHDVNAGNMFVIKDSQKNLRIARIDLGRVIN
ncbi:MAG: hypothetical protein LN588_03980 [Rickettsia endosymbiont of Bryobia graminum]|nr:hypothetical protein [Rickettsia endosymbiont of Bryobia graminum]